MATESCGSRGASPPPLHPSSGSGGAAVRWRKADAYREVLRRIRGGPTAGARPGFDDELWAHFHSLPARYVLDVNIERVEDVLLHKRLLEEAREPMNGLVFDVRHSQIATVDGSTEADSATSIKQDKPDPKCSALASSDRRPLYEVIFACDDKPKLLSQPQLDPIRWRSHRRRRIPWRSRLRHSPPADRPLDHSHLLRPRLPLVRHGIAGVRPATRRQRRFGNHFNIVEKETERKPLEMMDCFLIASCSTTSTRRDDLRSLRICTSNQKGLC